MTYRKCGLQMLLTEHWRYESWFHKALAPVNRYQWRGTSSAAAAVREVYHFPQREPRAATTLLDDGGEECQWQGRGPDSGRSQRGAQLL